MELSDTALACLMCQVSEELGVTVPLKDVAGLFSDVKYLVGIKLQVPQLVDAMTEEDVSDSEESDSDCEVIEIDSGSDDEYSCISTGEIDTRSKIKECDNTISAGKAGSSEYSHKSDSKTGKFDEGRKESVTDDGKESVIVSRKESAADLGKESVIDSGKESAADLGKESVIDSGKESAADLGKESVIDSGKESAADDAKESLTVDNGKESTADSGTKSDRKETATDVNTNSAKESCSSVTDSSVESSSSVSKNYSSFKLKKVSVTLSDCLKDKTVLSQLKSSKNDSTGDDGRHSHDLLTEHVSAVCDIDKTAEGSGSDESSNVCAAEKTKYCINYKNVSCKDVQYVTGKDVPNVASKDVPNDISKDVPYVAKNSGLNKVVEKRALMKGLAANTSQRWKPSPFALLSEPLVPIVLNNDYVEELESSAEVFDNRPFKERFPSRSNADQKIDKSNAVSHPQTDNVDVEEITGDGSIDYTVEDYDSEKALAQIEEYSSVMRENATDLDTERQPQIDKVFVLEHAEECSIVTLEQTADSAKRQQSDIRVSNVLENQGACKSGRGLDSECHQCDSKSCQKDEELINIEIMPAISEAGNSQSGSEGESSVKSTKTVLDSAKETDKDQIGSINDARKGTNAEESEYLKMRKGQIYCEIKAAVERAMVQAGRLKKSENTGAAFYHDDGTEEVLTKTSCDRMKRKILADMSSAVVSVVKETEGLGEKLKMRRKNAQIKLIRNGVVSLGKKVLKNLRDILYGSSSPCLFNFEFFKKPGNPGKSKGRAGKKFSEMVVLFKDTLKKEMEARKGHFKKMMETKRMADERFFNMGRKEELRLTVINDTEQTFSKMSAREIQGYTSQRIIDDERKRIGKILSSTREPMDACCEEEKKGNEMQSEKQQPNILILDKARPHGWGIDVVELNPTPLTRATNKMPKPKQKLQNKYMKLETPKTQMEILKDLASESRKIIFDRSGTLKEILINRHYQGSIVSKQRKLVEKSAVLSETKWNVIVSILYQLVSQESENFLTQVKKVVAEMKSHFPGWKTMEIDFEKHPTVKTVVACLRIDIENKLQELDFELLSHYSRLEEVTEKCYSSNPSTKVYVKWLKEEITIQKQIFYDLFKRILDVKVIREKDIFADGLVSGEGIAPIPMHLPYKEMMAQRCNMRLAMANELEGMEEVNKLTGTRRIKRETSEQVLRKVGCETINAIINREKKLKERLLRKEILQYTELKAEERVLNEFDLRWRTLVYAFALFDSKAFVEESIEKMKDLDVKIMDHYNELTEKLKAATNECTVSNLFYVNWLKEEIVHQKGSLYVIYNLMLELKNHYASKKMPIVTVSDQVRLTIKSADQAQSSTDKTVPIVIEADSSEEGEPPTKKVKIGNVLYEMKSEGSVGPGGDAEPQKGGVNSNNATANYLPQILVLQTPATAIEPTIPVSSSQVDLTAGSPNDNVARLPQPEETMSVGEQRQPQTESAKMKTLKVNQCAVDEMAHRLQSKIDAANRLTYGLNYASLTAQDTQSSSGYTISVATDSVNSSDGGVQTVNEVKSVGPETHLLNNPKLLPPFIPMFPRTSVGIPSTTTQFTIVPVIPRPPVPLQSGTTVLSPPHSMMKAMPSANVHPQGRSRIPAMSKSSQQLNNPITAPVVPTSVPVTHFIVQTVPVSEQAGGVSSAQPVVRLISVPEVSVSSLQPDAMTTAQIMTHSPGESGNNGINIKQEPEDIGSDGPQILNVFSMKDAENEGDFESMADQSVTPPISINSVVCTKGQEAAEIDGAISNPLPLAPSDLGIAPVTLLAGQNTQSAETTPIAFLADQNTQSSETTYITLFTDQNPQSAGTTPNTVSEDQINNEISSPEDEEEENENEKDIVSVKQKDELINKRYTVNKNKDGKKQFKCVTCSKVFNHRFSCIRHCKSHSVETGKKCEKCGSVFYSKNMFSRHYKSHFTIDHEAVSGPDRSTQVKIAEAKQNHDKRLHGCGACSLSCMSESHLKKHLRTHLMGQAYKCYLCNLSFTKDTTRDRHVQLHTIGEEGSPYQCYVCQNYFWFEYAVRNHFRLCHPASKKSQIDLTLAKKHSAIAALSRDKESDLDVNTATAGGNEMPDIQALIKSMEVKKEKLKVRQIELLRELERRVNTKEESKTIPFLRGLLTRDTVEKAGSSTNVRTASKHAPMFKKDKVNDREEEQMSDTEEVDVENNSDVDVENSSVTDSDIDMEKSSLAEDVDYTIEMNIDSDSDELNDAVDIKTEKDNSLVSAEQATANNESGSISNKTFTIVSDNSFVNSLSSLDEIMSKLKSIKKEEQPDVLAEYVVGNNETKFQPVSKPAVQIPRKYSAAEVLKYPEKFPELRRVSIKLKDVVKSRIPKLPVSKIVSERQEYRRQYMKQYRQKARMKKRLDNDPGLIQDDLGLGLIPDNDPGLIEDDLGHGLVPDIDTGLIQDEPGPGLIPDNPGTILDFVSTLGGDLKHRFDQYVTLYKQSDTLSGEEEEKTTGETLEADSGVSASLDVKDISLVDSAAEVDTEKY